LGQLEDEVLEAVRVAAREVLKESTIQDQELRSEIKALTNEMKGLKEQCLENRGSMICCVNDHEARMRALESSMVKVVDHQDHEKRLRKVEQHIYEEAGKQAGIVGGVAGLLTTIFALVGQWIITHMGGS
jgi:septal ring factor EnvC (AmiA/AmiB activator)